jgi:hypothetical protein
MRAPARRIKNRVAPSRLTTSVNNRWSDMPASSSAVKPSTAGSWREPRDRIQLFNSRS